MAANDYQTVVEGMQIAPFGTPASTPSETRIVVFLHGHGGKGDYLLWTAEHYAQAGTVSIVMAQPGCTIEGRKSVGRHDKDCFRTGRVAAVANALTSLKHHYQTDNLHVVGHSGGAAMAGVILGMYPGLVKGALLAACPTDVPRYLSMHGWGTWPRSKSPIKLIDTIQPDTKILLITGEQDSNTYPVLAEDYAAKAKAAGLDVEIAIDPTSGHNDVIDSYQFHDYMKLLLGETR